MKITKFYQVSAAQLFVMAMVTGLFAACLIVINTNMREYLLQPVVVMTNDNKCVTVANYRNGDAYNCSDVGVILRNYRKKVE